MDLSLADAMRAVLADWRNDLPRPWRPVLDGVDLGFDAMDPTLRLEPWEPIFPTRRDRVFPGAPKGAHMLRAFDGIEPEHVRVVLLGQDPYPAPDFATGRAFEAGNVAAWGELDKMFSASVRTFMQLIAAARTGNARYATSTGSWATLLAEIGAGSADIEPAAEIADRWVGQGVLLLNSALTLSRFAVEGDPHQLFGHLPLWRPLVLRVLKHLAARGMTAFIGFGDQAADAFRRAGISAGACPGNSAPCILREHPARGDAVLALENPFVACNALLSAMGGEPIRW